MKLHFFGDHSHLHCGSQAVYAAFRNFYKNFDWVNCPDEDYDILIINGEGTMHHSSKGFQRRMRRLKNAVSKGKLAFLLNSVWQDNGHEYDDLLPALNGIQVREVLSAEQMKTFHGFTPEIVPDLSYFAPIDLAAPIPDWSGRIVMTDAYDPAQNKWFIPALDSEIIYADMVSMSWSSFVLGLQRAKLLITGRHHAVYAACKARTPFVASTSNTHKIEGLMLTAGVNIPILKAPIRSDRALDHDITMTEFHKLFNFLESFDPKLPLASS